MKPKTVCLRANGYRSMAGWGGKEMWLVFTITCCAVWWGRRGRCGNGGLCGSGAWVAGYKCQQPSLGFGYTDIYTDILAVYFVALMCFECGKYFASIKSMKGPDWACALL
ncbi:MAG: hypothetical protein KIG52_06695 [Muribaculaceae bacterium]|nr:hypothetical protein [Muribaculaceae bacterium]